MITSNISIYTVVLLFYIGGGIGGPDMSLDIAREAKQVITNPVSIKYQQTYFHRSSEIYQAIYMYIISNANEQLDNFDTSDLQREQSEKEC